MRIHLALLLSASAAWGQDPPPEKKVIVTAKRREQEEFHTPASAKSLSTAEMRTERLSRTLPEALEESVGVSVQKTGPQQGSPFIRGWTGFRNVLLIDGIRLNNSVFREGPNQYWGTVDPFMVERLELVRGPSSVLYGSDAVGGTVQAFTFEPSTKETGLHLHERTYLRYASAENSYSLRQEVWGNQDGVGWWLGGSYRDFHDLSGGADYGKMTGTGYDEYDADLKLVFRVSENGKLVAAAQRHRTDDAARWHSTADSRSWHGTSPGTDIRRDFDQERDLYYLQYHWSAKDGFIDSLKVSVSSHRQAELENRITGGMARQVREHEVTTPGAWLQAGKQTDYGYFTFGGEYYRDIVDSSGHNWSAAGALTTFARGNVADEAEYDLFGVYLQDEIVLGSLEITPGIRFSRAAVDAEKVDPVPGGTTFPSIDEDYSATTGSLRLLYRVTENWNAVLGWGMGFRAPGLSDSTANQLVLSGATDVPALGLDPETFHTVDAGLRSRYESWEASAFVFYTDIDDLITRVPTATPGVFTKDNIGDGYMYGFELDARVRLSTEVWAFADWGYAKGEADQVTTPPVISEQPLGKIGPSIAHAGLRYEPAPKKIWIEGLVTAARHQKHLAPSETAAADGQRIPVKSGTPGYTIYTLRGGYVVSENVTVSGALENISDKDYRVHGSGQNEPGTNVVLGLDVRF